MHYAPELCTRDLLYTLRLGCRNGTRKTPGAQPQRIPAKHQAARCWRCKLNPKQSTPRRMPPDLASVLTPARMRSTNRFGTVGCGPMPVLPAPKRPSRADQSHGRETLPPSRHPRALQHETGAPRSRRSPDTHWQRSPSPAPCQRRSRPQPIRENGAQEAARPR